VASPLRNLPLTAKALAANFVVVPAVAYLLVRSLDLEHGLALGLILLACSAGDPFVTKLSQSARGDAAYSLAVMALLSVATVVAMPLMLPWLVPGIAVDPLGIAKPLVAIILLPLCLGLLGRRMLPGLARRAAPPLDRLASVLIYAAVALFAVVHWRDIVGSFGSHAILAAALLVVAGLAAGFALGGPAPRHRADLALNTGWRGVSAALAVGLQNFPREHEVFTMAIVMVLVAAAILMPLSATLLRRWNGATQ
jgi:BASS family bile acid:Na+ symporter